MLCLAQNCVRTLIVDRSPPAKCDLNKILDHHSINISSYPLRFFHLLKRELHFLNILFTDAFPCIAMGRSTGFSMVDP
jgi:hypothetical protein